MIVAMRYPQSDRRSVLEDRKVNKQDFPEPLLTRWWLTQASDQEELVVRIQTTTRQNWRTTTRHRGVVLVGCFSLFLPVCLGCPCLRLTALHGPIAAAGSRWVVTWELYLVSPATPVGKFTITLYPVVLLFHICSEYIGYQSLDV